MPGFKTFLFIFYCGSSIIIRIVSSYALMKEESHIGFFRVLSAMFLVAGTCIGGGMLALPLVTGISGFLPSLFMMFLCGLGMTVSALLLLEVSLWMEEGVHVITMASRILGPFGKVVSWILFLFISYASIVAYTAGGGVQIAELFSISKDLSCLIFVLFFGGIVIIGNVFVGRVNSLFFITMIGAYIALILTGFTEIKPELILYQKWNRSIISVPILLTAFSFQTMVPSLTPYLKKHKTSLRWSIVGGTCLTFIVYGIWQAIILGIIPSQGEKSLTEALYHGIPPTQLLKAHINMRWISYIAEFFGFFAIVTSFFGMTLGLYDFLSDGLHIAEKGKGKLLLAVLIIFPTYLFATQFERIFIIAMDLTGGIGDTIQNGMIPVLLVWVGHYVMKYPNSKPIFGGKILLVLTFIFFFACLLIELLTQTGYIYSYHDIIKVFDIREIEPT